MGITYKLLPKVKNFILKKKRDNPQLGCRKISDLVKKRFQISIGKSRIAWLLKKEELSSPIGRRRKRPYLKIRLLPCEGMGYFFLKCADLSLRGTSSLIEPIRKRFPNLFPFIIQEKFEILIYLRLLGIKDLEEIKKMGGLPQLILLISGKNYRYPGLFSYHHKLQRLRTLNLEVFSQFTSSLEEGLYFKFFLQDGDTFYLDSQMHSVWSEPKIPSDFSLGINRIKEYLDSFIQGNQPLILQSCPGFDLPTKEFFYFMRAMEAKEKIYKIKSIFVHSEETKLLDFEPIEFKKRYFIIGLLPWQYRNFRSIKQLNGFRRIFLPIFKEEIEVSEAEVELTEPKSNQRVKLRGSLLRSKEKIRIIILTNISDRLIEEIILRYLERWPNLEEGFEDFSQKIQAATYRVTKKIRPPEPFFSPSLKLEEIFDFWLNCLNYYCQRHFFPPEYRDLDFEEIKKRFYNLEGGIEKKANLIFVKFSPPQNYDFLKDLLYCCRRVNESDIITIRGERIYFEPQITQTLSVKSVAKNP